MYASRITRPISVVVVRHENLYGPFDKFTVKESKDIAELMRQAVDKELPFTVRGDGRDIKDFLYIDDFINALIPLTEMANLSGPVKIASGIPVSIRDNLPIILDAAGHHGVDLAFDESRPNMIPRRLIDISYLQRLISWHPQVWILDGIKKTVDWYKETYPLQSPEALQR